MLKLLLFCDGSILSVSLCRLPLKRKGVHWSPFSQSLNWFLWYRYAYLPTDIAGYKETNATAKSMWTDLLWFWIEPAFATLFHGGLNPDTIKWNKIDWAFRKRKVIDMWWKLYAIISYWFIWCPAYTWQTQRYQNNTTAQHLFHFPAESVNQPAVSQPAP